MTYLQVYCYNSYLRGCEYRKGIRCELRFWRVMLREDIVDNRLIGDVRMYGVDNEIDVNFDYCDEILKLMDIVRFAYIYMGRRSRLCIYTYYWF